DPGNEFPGAQRFRDPFFDTGDQDIVGTLTTGSSIALYLHRNVPAGTRKRTSAAWALVALTQVTTDDPNPLVSVCPIVFDVESDDPALTFSPDRFPAISGGSRLEGRVVDSVSGLPIENRAAVIDADVGTMVDPTADRVTNAAGDVAATYTSPTNPALEGTTVNFTMKVGAGDEV
ncbi:hypothetical protein LCGC14_2848030, partial [marine sediment metagenome]